MCQPQSSSLSVAGSNQGGNPDSLNDDNPDLMKVDKSKQQPTKNNSLGSSILADRTDSGRATSQDTRCHHIIRLLLARDDRWYLKENSNLLHSFHEELPPESNVLGEKDLSEQERSWIERMYETGISNGVIASVMTGYFDKEGKAKGEFLTQTIENLTKKIQKECDLVKNISPDMTIAEKTLQELNS